MAHFRWGIQRWNTSARRYATPVLDGTRWQSWADRSRTRRMATEAGPPEAGANADGWGLEADRDSRPADEVLCLRAALGAGRSLIWARARPFSAAPVLVVLIKVL